MTYTIHSKWYELKGMIELTNALQSKPTRELMARYKMKNEIIKQVIIQCQGFQDEMFGRLKGEIETHSLLYPMKFWPSSWYCSDRKRKYHERVQSILRGIPLIRRKLKPKPISSPIIPIILPGVNYTAESLVVSGELSKSDFPTRDNLTWFEKNAYADYYHDVMTYGSEHFVILLKTLFGDIKIEKKFSDPSVKAFDTLWEEQFHRISNQIAGPRYGKKDLEKEHYWMNEYGSFPEKVSEMIINVSQKYVGVLSYLNFLHVESGS